MTTVVITGGTSGIGEAAARALSTARGARVIIGGRNRERGEAIAAQIDARFLPLDLESQRSIRWFASEIGDGVDVLIHNAGAVYTARRLTEDGFEAQMAVMHLGPFLLTELLRPKFSSSVRIVNVVSELHKMMKPRHDDVDDVHSARRYGSVRAYARAELYKTACGPAWARRLPGAEVVALHPGGVRTRLFRDFRGPLGALWWLSGWLKQSPSRAARALVELACDDVENGGYYVSHRLRRASELARDEAFQERVFSRSAELVRGQGPVSADIVRPADPGE